MNDPPPASLPHEQASPPGSPLKDRLKAWLRPLRHLRDGDGSARDTLEELIEEREESEIPLDSDERRMLANILELRGSSVRDVMVPRADIVAVGADASLDDVIAIMTREGHSRLPMFRTTLDDTFGMVHIKDVIAWKGSPEGFKLAQVLRKVLFVAPSMRVLELLLEMRVTGSHMALVVDEYGGVDGLVTIEDLVEEIVGEIADEHDRADEPRLVRRTDGTLDADARVTVEALEAIAGPLLAEDEREDIDTVGGLVAAVAGRVPIRGEIVRHPSGLEFEVIDADPRRVKRVRVRGVSVAPMPGA